MPDGCDGEVYLTTEELSAYLKVPVGTLRFWRSKGRGPEGAKVGRRWLYRRDDADRWFDQQKQRPPTSS